MAPRPVIVLGTFVLGGFFFGSGIAQWLAPQLDSTDPLPLADITLTDRHAPDPLLGFLFAPTDPPPPPPPPTDEADGVCEVPWRLVGTMLDHDSPSRSFAAIQTPEGHRLLATSMTHTELTLVELAAEAVTLERADGRRCEIRMFTTTSRATTITPIAATPNAPSDPRVRHISSSHVQIDSALLDAPGALQGVHPIPVMRNGQLSGVRLVGVRRSSPLAAAGVQNGDVISSVDGQPLQSPDVALVALGRLRSGQPVRVTIERGGSSRQMTLSTARPR